MGYELWIRGLWISVRVYIGSGLGYIGSGLGVMGEGFMD